MRIARRSLLALPVAGLAGAAVAGCSAPTPTPRGAATVAIAPTPSRVPDPHRVTYGSDPSQYGELHLPVSRPRAVAVVVHGGFWKAQYGLEYGTPLAQDLARRGWAAWNIEYRRVGDGGGVPQTLDDVTAAIAKLDDLGLDLTTVVGIGHSAGGHLVTWAASGGRLTHVVDQAGVVDLRSAYREDLGDGAVEAFLGHPPGPGDADVDPIRRVPLDVPLWAVHAGGDTIVPISQSRDYVLAAKAAGARAELVEVEGDHFTVIDPSSPAWARTVEILDAIA